ncbi:hypothetical protein Dda_2048 [Drechslerella dactyloides]|uniref:Uncharacterized protein n=1 Tax=Drechslerella dactyloides TaxID=74499 RepID=A0AAD6NM09_DREDA|nr:hypothetical protein Dda_2048 [Drechslerella dactyloides]
MHQLGEKANADSFMRADRCGATGLQTFNDDGERTSREFGGNVAFRIMVEDSREWGTEFIKLK